MPILELEECPPFRETTNFEFVINVLQKDRSFMESSYTVNMLYHFFCTFPLFFISELINVIVIEDRSRTTNYILFF